MLISSCLPIQFNHFWYHFSKVSNIFLTLLCIHCLPELHNPINQLLFRCRLYFPSDVSSCHKFSIGLRSGDSGGVCHQLIPFSSMNFFACFDVCLGSLSRTNLCVVGISCLEMGSTSCPEFGYIVVRSFSLRKCRFQLGLSD